ncbi:MAG: hypothetical protein H0W88_05435 [Parachlamydiaceae bacterium]|nr:hypothetical protein [Parachlamydiaceae bacterium]
MDKTSNVNSEALADCFMKLVEERYPSPERIIQLVSALLPNEDDSINTLKKKIIYVNMMRDSVKEVSPNYVYRSMQHRDELFSAILEASEELEDDLQDLEEGIVSEDEDEDGDENEES